MSWSVYCSDYFEVRNHDGNKDVIEQIIQFYSELFRFKGVKAGTINKLVINRKNETPVDVLEGDYVDSHVKGIRYLDSINKLREMDSFEFLIVYSLEVRAPFVPSIVHFSELLENTSPCGVDFKCLNFCDEDDDIILYRYNESEKGYLGLREGYESVLHIQSWRDVNYFLNLDLSNEDYMMHRSEIDRVLNQIADINQTSLSIEEYEGRTDLNLGRSSEFNINDLMEYKLLLERLLGLISGLDANLLLENNMFSYEFATLSVSIKNGSVVISSAKL